MRDSTKLRWPPVFELVAAICHRHIAPKSVRIPSDDKKSRYPNGYLLFLAEDEGFEPPQTESESGVLPLHKSSIGNDLIIRKTAKKSSSFWPFYKFNYFLPPVPRGKAYPSGLLCADSRRLSSPPHHAAWSEYESVPVRSADASTFFHGF